MQMAAVYGKRRDVEWPSRRPAGHHLGHEPPQEHAAVHVSLLGCSFLSGNASPGPSAPRSKACRVADCLPKTDWHNGGRNGGGLKELDCQQLRERTNVTEGKVLGQHYKTFTRVLRIISTGSCYRRKVTQLPRSDEITGYAYNSYKYLVKYVFLGSETSCNTTLSLRYQLSERRNNAT